MVYQAVQDSDPREMGKMKWVLQLPSLLPLENFQVIAQGGKPQAESGRLPELYKWSWESGKTKGG